MAAITLLSDFGLQDASVAIAKGIIMQHAEGLPIIDISHEVTPFQSAQAAYLLSSAYINFPEGTCHLLIFDLFASTNPRLILSLYKGHYFLSADNNLVTSALGTAPDACWLCFELQPQHTFADWMTQAAILIHSLQTKAPGHLGLQEYNKTEKTESATPTNKDVLDCTVIHIDRYENVILNVNRAKFDTLADQRSFSLQFMEIEEITELSINYNDVKEGYKLCRFNSSDQLEICVNRGKAASLFGLRIGSTHNKIKIVFK